jgi:quercetin dioxygenase-like cupin family protein
VQYLRVYAGPDGESHFEDVTLDRRSSSIGVRSQIIPATALIFTETPAGTVQDWHTTPRRQFMVYLAGAAVLTVSDGESRRVGPGDVVLVEDMTGRGHRVEVLDSADRRALIVPLEAIA